jgi:23S rRNA (uracil1939-C5)-methyltransferase
MSAICRHFGHCGGCAFQDLSPDAYRERKRAQVAAALARHRVDAAIAAPLQTAPGTRRRAALKAAKRNGAVDLGFNAARSHAVVDMQECLVLTPALVSLIPALRKLFSELLNDGQKADVALTETETGFDIALDWPAVDFARAVTIFAHWVKGRDIARMSVNGDVAIQLAEPRIRIGASDVLLPATAFLQPSREGERILQGVVLDSLQGARRVADLFAGCGTFALALAERASVHAVDSDEPALTALLAAARQTRGLKPVTTEARDLFKRPLRPEELNGFDTVLLDPPRAGARAQAEMIGPSRAARLAYVSCNPETFARDAAILTRDGFVLRDVRPVDQFLWSTHIELVGSFERQPGWSQRRKD